MHQMLTQLKLARIREIHQDWLDRAVASGSSGGQRPSLGGYVTTRGSTDGRAGARRALVLPSMKRLAVSTRDAIPPLRL